MGASRRLRLIEKADTLRTSTPRCARGGTGGKMKPNRRQFLGASVAERVRTVLLAWRSCAGGRGHDVRACGAQPQFARAGLRRPGGRQLGEHADLRHPGEAGGRHLRGDAGRLQAVAGRELDHLRRWPHLDVPAPQGRQVPRRLRRGHGGRRHVHVRTTARSQEAGRSPAAVRRNHREHHGGRSRHRRLQAQAARSAVLRQHPLYPWWLHRLAEGLGRTRRQACHESDRHRRLPVRPDRSRPRACS